MNSFSFEAIGTSWNIDIVDDISEEKVSHLESVIKARIEIFDKTYSRFRRDSEIYKMSIRPGTYKLPADAEKLFTFYKQLYDITEGAFTPLIGDVLIAAGYDESYSLKTGKLTHPKHWEEILSYHKPAVTIKEPTMLDFGAAGKGYLVDIVAHLLDKEKIESYCVDGSGDIFYKHKGNNPLQIGLEHPEDQTQAIGIVTLTKGSLCGSAGNKRKWGQYHHIMNPHTLTSPTTILSLWVTAENTMLADALTTCLFFTPAEKLHKYFDFEYAIVKNDYTLEKSEHFPGEFFYK